MQQGGLGLFILMFMISFNKFDVNFYKCFNSLILDKFPCQTFLNVEVVVVVKVGFNHCYYSGETGDIYCVPQSSKRKKRLCIELHKSW